MEKALPTSVGCAAPRADDRIRTGDPHLGKVMLYQLSYVRMTRIRRSCRGRYWDRTSDLFRVKEARYPCANRPRGPALSSGLGTAYTVHAEVRTRSDVTYVVPHRAPQGGRRHLSSSPSARATAPRRRAGRGGSAEADRSGTGPSRDGDLGHDQAPRFASTRRSV